MIVAAHQLFDWLSQSALPLWSAKGVDRKLGGFVERMDHNGQLDAEVRRARLVARQTYAFRIAGELGWQGPSVELARHGQLALLRDHIGADLIAIPQFRPDQNRHIPGFDLYDQAFVLFGLSQIARLPGEAATEDLAKQMLVRMRSDWQHPLGGFGETLPIIAPLKANPHMHIFEAAQSWLEISQDPVWYDLADEVANLCVDRFLDAKTGALHEFFDVKWQPFADSDAHVIEPGHQAEWAWLLVRWFRRTGDKRYFSAAQRLFEISENEGIHGQHGKLVNELDSSLTMKDRRMRLWPQTERIKALIVFCEEAKEQSARDELEARLDAAVAGLMTFFDHPIEGSWWEHIADDGSPCCEPARASSLYHIMGAAAELARHSGLRLS